MTKIPCVLYDDLIDGYPKSYPRNDLFKSEAYPDGQTQPTLKQIDFKPREFLGNVSGGLRLHKLLKKSGYAFIVTSDKDEPDSVFEKELPDADIVIFQPFWSTYLTEDGLNRAESSTQFDPLQFMFLIYN